jgi:hypothetical protein
MLPPRKIYLKGVVTCMKYAFIAEKSLWNKKISKEVHAFFAFIRIESPLPQWTILNNYIETKAKCGHQKKCTCKGTLRQVFIYLRPHPAPSPPMTPYTPPPLHTVSVYVLLSILIHTEKGGGRANQREG